MSPKIDLKIIHFKHFMTNFRENTVCICMYVSLIPRPLLIQYVVWQYAAIFLGETEAIGHVTSAH